MLILGTPFSWGRQLICCLDIPGMSLFVGEVFYFYFFLRWKLPDICDTQVVAKESSNWEKKLSIQFEVNFILDVKGNVMHCIMEFTGWGVLDTSFENEFPFLSWFCTCCISYASCIVTSSWGICNVEFISNKHVAMVFLACFTSVLIGEKKLLVRVLCKICMRCIVAT